MKAWIGLFAAASVATGTLFGYECCPPGPLTPCTFSITERGGIDPAYYTYRQANEYRNIVGLSEAFLLLSEGGPIFELEGTLLTQTESVRAAKFDDQFNVPWYAGGEIGLAVSCNTEIFIDGFYTRAEGRSDEYTLNFPAVPGQLEVDGIITPLDLKPAEEVEIEEEYSDLQSYGGHLGARYYFPSWCGCISPFVGIKAGFRHWEGVRAKYTVTFFDVVNEEQTIRHTRSYYPSHDVVSGGFQLGINLCFSRCLSLVLMAEAIGVGAFKFGQDTEFDRGVVNTTETTLGDATVLREANTILVVPVRRSGTIITYPVTLGLKLSF